MASPLMLTLGGVSEPDTTVGVPPFGDATTTFESVSVGRAPSCTSVTYTCEESAAIAVGEICNSNSSLVSYLMLPAAVDGAGLVEATEFDAPMPD